MTSDASIRDHIKALIDSEHSLRAQLVGHTLGQSAEHAELAALEAEHDQCWDLLRQRQAARDAGLSPDTAKLRDAETVEGYLS
jgi:hypothetical protein